MFSRLCGILVIVLSLAIAGSALAQAAPTVGLSNINIDSFPYVQAFLDVDDAQGGFIHGLKPENVSVIENGVVIPVTALNELRPGVQLVIAFDPGTSFAIRDIQGRSRGQIIADAISSWAKNRQGSTIDDLSLVVTNGSTTSHLNSPAEWLKRLKLADIDFRQSTPSLDTLFQAIDIAADQPTRPGMGRAVLYITTPTESQAGVPIENAIANAQAQGVQVYVWMVPVPGAFYPNAEKQLEALSSQTGGQIFKFADDQPVLDIEGLLDPLRSTYQLAYNSQVRSSGSHEIAAQIELPTGSIPSPVQSYDLTILPPDPAFISPPLEINRQPPVEAGEEQAQEVLLENYLPTLQELQTVVSFPDERIRQLVRTSLFVDGELVQENRQAPFDRFQWDLSTYTATVPHLIRVEAEDNLGLVGTSIERLVQLNLVQPARDPWSWVYRNASALSILAAVVTGSVLLLILLLGGRLRPRFASITKQARRYNDPVTQPVPIKAETTARRMPAWTSRKQWPERQIPPRAYAYLSRITETDGADSLTPLPIMSEEIAIGSDPHRATLVIKDPSVEGLHARMMLVDDGAFRITDEGSIAGTWINYAPISGDGSHLEHGDLIHFGRAGFRFTLVQPRQIRRPVVAPVNSHEVDQV